MRSAPWFETTNPGGDPIAIYGFVTGQIRNFFEQKDPREDFEDENAIFASVFPESVQPITSLIGITLFGSHSYLLPTQVEGECQIEGARTMYEQFNQSQQQKLLPVASLGIGMETAQWAQHRQEPFTFRCGMNNPALCEIGTKIIDRYRKDPIQFRILCGVSLSLFVYASMFVGGVRELRCKCRVDPKVW